MARYPESKQDILQTLFVDCTISESTGIYSLIIVFIIFLLSHNTESKISPLVLHMQIKDKNND